MKIDFPECPDKELKIYIKGELVAEVCAGANQSLHVGQARSWEKEIEEARTAIGFYRWACQALEAICGHSHLTKFKKPARTETSLAEAFLRGLSGNLTPGSLFGMPLVEYAANIVYEPASPESELCQLGSAMARAAMVQSRLGFPKFDEAGQGVMAI
jgi:hypothetical protein